MNLKKYKIGCSEDCDCKTCEYNIKNITEPHHIKEIFKCEIKNKNVELIFFIK